MAAMRSRFRQLLGATEQFVGSAALPADASVFNKEILQLPIPSFAQSVDQAARTVSSVSVTCGEYVG